MQPDSHEAGITAPVEHFLEPLVVDLRPGPEGKTANFYFGQNHEGQIIFCYTPKELFVGTDRESLSEFLPILAARMICLVPRLRHLLVRRVWRGLLPHDARTASRSSSNVDADRGADPGGGDVRPGVHAGHRGRAGGRLPGGGWAL